jgi:hypothetical protein
MTQKEFLNYEQALALKELGFDEHCLASFYTYTDENFILNKYDYRGKFNINYSGEDDYIINTDKTHYISAPLYQQAFRWLYQKLEINGVMPLDEESQIILLKELIDRLSSKCSLV